MVFNSLTTTDKHGILLTGTHPLFTIVLAAAHHRNSFFSESCYKQVRGKRNYHGVIIHLDHQCAFCILPHRNSQSLALAYLDRPNPSKKPQCLLESKLLKRDLSMEELFAHNLHSEDKGLSQFEAVAAFVVYSERTE